MRRSGTIEVDGAVIEAHHLWYIREELRLYPRRKKRLTYLHQVIVGETPVNETPGIQSGTTSDPTLGRAMALMHDQEVAWLEPRIEWIDRVWDRLAPETQKVLNLMVVSATHTAAGVANAVPGLSEHSVYRELYRGLLAFAIDMWGTGIILNGKIPKRLKLAVSGGSSEVKFVP